MSMKMKMKEIIDCVSELYREEHNKEKDLRNELVAVRQTLLDADYTCGENISFAEYNRLIDRLKSLQDTVDMQNQFCNGISCVRELLMDLGFDTEVE